MGERFVWRRAAEPVADYQIYQGIRGVAAVEMGIVK